jgi:hypothetical protein
VNTALFFQKIQAYYPISAAAEMAWAALLREKHYQKGESLVNTMHLRTEMRSSNIFFPKAAWQRR